MIFYTDITTNASNYCMLNVKKYKDKRKNVKKEAYIDPSVYELTKRHDFSRLAELHYLSSGNLREREFISLDYPCDMLVYKSLSLIHQILKRSGLSKKEVKKEMIRLRKYHKDKLVSNFIYGSVRFIEKSYNNNMRYKNNLKYICTIQSEFRNYNDFVFQAERLKTVWKIKDKIIGLGNMCRFQHTDKYSDDVFRWIVNNMQGKRVHVYGMPLRHIKKYVPKMENVGIIVSVDSTKWTRRVHKKKELAKAVMCRKDTRDVFFTEYMNEIKLAGIKVEY